MRGQLDQTPLASSLGDGNHEAQIGFDELVFGLSRVHLALNDFALGALQLLKANAGIAFQPFQVAAILLPCLAVTLLQFFAARAFNLLSQSADLAVERAHDVHGSIHPIDQAFALPVARSEEHTSELQS